MKKIIVYYFLFFTYYFASAQNWYPVGKGIGPNGAFMSYKGSIYIGGEFDDTVNGQIMHNIVKWDGMNFIGVGGGVTMPKSQTSTVEAFALFNGKLIVGGVFDSAGNIPVNNIAAWDGTTWSALGKGCKDAVTALAVYNGNLYASGMDSAGGKYVQNIAAWDGTNWVAVGTGTAGANGGMILTLTAYDSVLYAGGWFTLAGGAPANHIAQWNGATWSALGTGITSGPYSSVIGTDYTVVQSTAIYNGMLYVGGTFDSAGNSQVANIAAWNGTSWLSPINGVYEPGTNGVGYGVYSLATNNNKLYIGGLFTNVGSILANNIAAWNGAVCTPLGSGVNGPSPYVYGIGFYYDSVFHDSALYAGGSFTSAGGKPANNIAVWTTDTLTGIKELSIKTENIIIYPNPSTGIFNFNLLGNTEKNTLTIYNMFGENIYNTQCNTNTTQIDLSGKPAGVYLYRIVSEKGEAISSGKLVIQ